jgi:hypothetical protein
MGNDHARLGQKVFDIPQAKDETVVRPDSISDYGAGKAVPLEVRDIVEVQHASELQALNDIINLTVPARLNWCPSSTSLATISGCRAGAIRAYRRAKSLLMTARSSAPGVL